MVSEEKDFSLLKEQVDHASTFYPNLGDYLGELQGLLRKLRVEKREQRHRFDATVRQLEEELHAAQLSNAGAMPISSDSGESKLKEAQQEIKHLQNRLVASRNECRSLKDELVHLFNEMVEPVPLPMPIKEIEEEMKTESKDEATECMMSEEMRETKEGKDYEKLKVRLEKERKRRKTAEERAGHLEAENAALKKVSAEADARLQSTIVDRNHAVEQLESLQSRVGSDEGRGLSLLRKKHRDEVDKLNRRLADAQRELELIKNKSN